MDEEKQLPQITLTARPLQLIRLPPEMVLDFSLDLAQGLFLAAWMDHLESVIDDPQPDHVLDSIKSG